MHSTKQHNTHTHTHTHTHGPDNYYLVTAEMQQFTNYNVHCKNIT